MYFNINIFLSIWFIRRVEWKYLVIQNLDTKVFIIILKHKRVIYRFRLSVLSENNKLKIKKKL